MLSLLVLAIAAGVSPAPAAPASPAPALKEIAHVRSSTTCAELVTHANAAIGAALGNDAIVNQTIVALRANGLDGNDLTRRNALAQLRALADRLSDQYQTGNGEIVRLRAIAARAPTPEGKSELLAFSNWLGGALWRQKRIGRDLDGFLATLDAKDMTQLDDSQQDMLESATGRTAVTVLHPHEVELLGGLTPAGPKLAPRDVTSPPQLFQRTDGQLAQAAAVDFLDRTAAIQRDEAMAAEHADGISEGC